MQNRYVGDIGDYGKYALLRALCQPDPVVRLAVVWCLFPDESFNNDGRHISYLRDNHFAQLDFSLHAQLADIVSRENRTVAAIEEAGCLPASTIFFRDSVLPICETRPGPSERVRHRAEWLEACLYRTRECELAFFDPDNGLEIASVSKGHPKGGKYIYWDELVRFWQRGNSLLVYHHLNRAISAAQQVELLARQFAVHLVGAKAVALVFRRGSTRVFWLIHRGDNLGRELERRATEMLSGSWSRHFWPIGWRSGDQAGTCVP